MKVGIIGSGNVGQALGSGFAALKYDVKLGTRDPHSQKVKDWIKKNKDRVSAGTFADAAAFAEIAVLATRWVGTENAIRLADPKNLAGKIVIDVTNPLVFPESGVPILALGHTDSGGEQVQRWLQFSRIVKAFNTVSHAHMVKPKFKGGPPDMFLCGNDENAKNLVAEICKSLGWEPVDIGDLRGARLLEPLSVLWITFGMMHNSWNHAFKLLLK